jgi:hypothetical protein
VLTALSSSIRTVTVGPGLSPDLLTSFLNTEGALAGSPEQLGYRRWGITPRPENKLGGRIPVFNRLAIFSPAFCKNDFTVESEEEYRAHRFSFSLKRISENHEMFYRSDKPGIIFFCLTLPMV